MYPTGIEIRVLATRARLGHRLGDDIVFAEIDAYAVPDLVLALTPEQARALAEQLLRPSGRLEQAFRTSRWLGRWTRRSA